MAIDIIGVIFIVVFAVLIYEWCIDDSHAMLTVKIIKEFSQRLLDTLDIPLFIYHDTSISYDKQIVIDGLQRLRTEILCDGNRNRSISASVTYIINGVNLFYDDDIDAAKECFSSVEIVSREVGISSRLEDIFLSTRLQLLSKVLLSDYFSNEFCHKYVIGRESCDVVESLFRQPQLQVAVDDEFAPLLYPRTFGHTHLTRVPILRVMSRINSYLMDHYECRVAVRVSVPAAPTNPGGADMKQVQNTAFYKVPRQDRDRISCRHRKHKSGDRHMLRKQIGGCGAGQDRSTEPLRVTALTAMCSGMLCVGIFDGRICVFDNRKDCSRGTSPPPMLRTLSAPCGSCVNCMCTVGDVLLAGYESGNIVVWDCGSESAPGAMLCVISASSDTGGHTGAVRSLGLFTYPLENPWHDSNRTTVTRPFVVLSASVDSSVGIWDVSGCLNIRVDLTNAEESAPVGEFEFEGCADDAVAGAGGSLVRHMGMVQEAMSVNAAVMEWACRGHGDGRTGVPGGHWDYRRNSRTTWLRIFTACGTGTWHRVIRVFTGHVDGYGCTQSGTLKGHDDHVHALVSIPKRDLLVSASADRTLRLWSTFDLTALGCIHSSIDVICMVFRSDELYISSVDATGVEVWDVDTMEHKTKAVHKDMKESSVTALCISGGILYCGLECGIVCEIFV